MQVYGERTGEYREKSTLMIAKTEVIQINYFTLHPFLQSQFQIVYVGESDPARRLCFFIEDKKSSSSDDNPNSTCPYFLLRKIKPD